VFRYKKKKGHEKFKIIFPNKKKKKQAAKIFAIAPNFKRCYIKFK
jgi:hypothetical protein